MKQENTTEQAVTEQWWLSFYDYTFSEFVLEQRTSAEIELIHQFLVDKLALTPGKSLFDQCCGKGDISISLAEKGVSVIGIDASETYIDEINSKRYANDELLEYCVGDARYFKTKNPCDVAISWYTSFGGLSSNDENQLFIDRAYDSLKSGGTFALDYYNADKVLAEFKPRLSYTKETANGAVQIERLSKVDDSGMLCQSWTYTDPSGKQEVRFGKTKLYTANHIKQMLEKAGFIRVKFYGSYAGDPYTPESPRCIAVATKPFPWL